MPIAYEPTVGAEMQRIKTDHWEISLQEVGFALKENWKLYFKKAGFLIVINNILSSLCVFLNQYFPKFSIILNLIKKENFQNHEVLFISAYVF